MMYRLITKIPILGVILKIFNSYAYDGDLTADDRFAGGWSWIKAYFFSFAFSLAVTLMLMPDLINSVLPQCFNLRYQVQLPPGDLSISILPNLLGFGIGVYALVFALDRRLIQDLQQTFQKSNESSKTSGSALLLNTEMALPLVVLTLTVAIGVFQKIFTGSTSLMFAAWFSFWLSIYFTLELINTLFMMGGAHLSQSLKKDGE